MVHIITGPRDSGKTTMIRRLYAEIDLGDGILSEKVFLGGSFAGYSVQRLSSGIRVPLASVVAMVPPEWDEYHRHCGFSFSRSGVDFACAVLDEIADMHISPVFIDEVGPMELSGYGLISAGRIFASCCDVYVTVRDRCIAQFIEYFRISDHTVIHVAD